jgi:uncharacterized protein YdaU (DUF1376 family)
MAKDPAFLFYPNDWIGGTMGMTFEEKGAYMELLMMQFNRGHMTSHMIGQMVGHLWDNIKDKFIQDEHGKWYNVRLEEEKIKRENFTKSRRGNLSGINQHTKSDKKITGHTDSHMTSHMENVNVNEIEDDNKGGMGGKCLFKNSGVSVQDIRAAFENTTDIKNADPARYFNDLMDWSNGKGEMRKDWVATARVFARRDLDAGKLKVKKSITVNPVNAASSVSKDFGKPNPSAIPYQEYKKRKGETVAIKDLIKE